ncbi:cupin domain-containing protein [Streptomyces sp. HUAS TT20]|uniref:cupin domain-containing protein n=1 Tax=Streptomyces sp. HUAS TT20 TaxID=3447509 RepID=UPI0021D86214|nr:cupin domain-containing protein [Streptomyces sp. HUAS 15-9]UXY33040.1 cupin domain-containing protein [Streptomyces sp. HUAS 15-9]
MSLGLLLPPDGAADLLADWPDAPRVYERGTTEIDHIADCHLDEWIDTGCVPASEVAVLRAGPALNPGAFKTNGRLDPAKLRRLHTAGHTIRLGNLQRVIPAFTRVCQAIQKETRYSNYVHAFLTPAGEQGLLHHWDQQMAVIVQVAGVKTWQLWKPVYDAPMREYQESWRVWQDHFIPMWESTGPDLTIDLAAGQTLVLPRGWVHNPHARDSTADSIHLTFAIRERTPFWAPEQLVARAIERPEFRRIILPRELEGPIFTDRLGETRKALIGFLNSLDLAEMAGLLRETAVTDLEYTT